MSFQYDVFISHSSKDKPVARELAQRLRDDGLKVWFDEWDITPGDLIGLKVEQGLEHSRILLLLMSSNALASEWVTLERHTVLFRDPTNAQRRFIPIRLDDSEIKDTLKQFAYIDWRTKLEDEYQRLLTVCRFRSDSEGDTELTTTAQQIDSVWGASIFPGSQKAVTGSRDGRVEIWDMQSRALISSHQCRHGAPGRHNGIVAALPLVNQNQILIAYLDPTLRIWDLAKGKCVAELFGHRTSVYGADVTPDGRTAISGSYDGQVIVWDVEDRVLLRTLDGHKSAVRGLSITPDGSRAITGSYDRTIRVWDLNGMMCVGMLEGHTSEVWGVAITADGQLAVSASDDSTVRIWDLRSMSAIAILEGHTKTVTSVAITPDGRRAVSGSRDSTIRVWDLDTGFCTSTFTGVGSGVYRVSLSPDGRRVVSGVDRTADQSPTLMIWNLLPVSQAAEAGATRYTNAKVVLIGETGVGKTALAIRLCEDRYEKTESTHGMQVRRLHLSNEVNKQVEREVWLWDFAGQADYRLIHQLYTDETALALIVFNPQDHNLFETLGYWEKALRTASKYSAARLLVAGRCDRGGLTVSNKLVEEFCRKHNVVKLINTVAKTGQGCDELKQSIAQNLPWERLPWTSTTRVFKVLKDAILSLKQDSVPIVRMQELRQRLQLMCPQESIGPKELRAVVGLMQGQGLVQVLGFGDFVLLQPEQINQYASIVVRMAREHIDEMGSVSEKQVLDGDLDFKDNDFQRMGETDEKILLRTLVQTFLNRALCLREQTPNGTMLVFPYYFRRDKPDVPQHPHILVTYGFIGSLEDIYSTLVVRLSYSDIFTKEQLWKNAADFKTPAGRRAGIAMKDKGEGAAEIVVYFDEGIPEDTKVTFIKYVHEHLLRRAQDVTRVRTYVCPACGVVVENREVIQKRLHGGKRDIVCANCENRVQLLDLIEDKFSSDKFLNVVRQLDNQARIKLDNESKELMLIGHAFAIAGEAGQIFRPTPNSDWGIDGEIEFKDDKGAASGKRVYVQLKSGDSYLHVRESDGREMFTIRNPRHVEYWQAHEYPVMLVIRASNGLTRWMNITDYLARQPFSDATQPVIFEGEEFTALNLVRLRDRLFAGPLGARR